MLTTGEFNGVSTHSPLVTPSESISISIFSPSNSTDDSGPTSNGGFSVPSIAYLKMKHIIPIPIDTMDSHTWKLASKFGRM